VIAYLLERPARRQRSLARGTRAVAKGDFSQMPSLKSRDELGVLIQSFNRMTRQLSEAREQVAQNYQQTEQAKAFLERVLANLSSGVVVLDDALQVRTMNSAAAHILGVEAARSTRAACRTGQPGEVHCVRRQLRRALSTRRMAGTDRLAGTVAASRCCCAAPACARRRARYVLVFDDVTS
jgi:nitrogen fixation/metabolism regulation signal transduction histidine kinase